MARNCKVITTCFVGREVRYETAICGDPPGPFLHAQVFPDAESVLELLELNREFELAVDPGVECDTILVNNDVGWERGNRFLASLDGTRTFAGRFRVLTRENFGVSLGGYNHAYGQLGTEYDYWTFAEDDILITGDKWLARCLDDLRLEDGVGFVAIQGLSRDYALHAHAGMGTTHVSVLEAVRKIWGTLPHRRRDETQNNIDHIIFGEVLFTHLIHRLGRRLVTVQSERPLYTFAYDYMRQTGRVRRESSGAAAALDAVPPADRPASRPDPPPAVEEAVAEVEHRLSRCQADLEALQVERAALEKALGVARRDAAALRASLSWRMTAPARGILDLWRRGPRSPAGK
jgi:hypothetical protein